jgi:ElaB/YqjD/DUF883 family membrane-anchored ribosome-binding protein
MSSNPGFEGGQGTETQAGKPDQLREELERLGQAAKDAAYQQMEMIRDRGREKARALEDSITAQPLRSVLIASGIGFVLGALWARR